MFLVLPFYKKYLYIEMLLSEFCIGSLEHNEAKYNSLWPVFVT